VDEKKQIIENAVNTLISMGYDEPKVAVLAAVEKVNPKMPESVDAGLLKEMNQNGEIKNCIVEGRFKQDRLDGKLEIILDGTAYRPIDFIPHSKDKRKLMAKFFWLAIFRVEEKPAG
jgi:hypothetical protein